MYIQALFLTSMLLSGINSDRLGTLETQIKALITYIKSVS